VPRSSRVVAGLPPEVEAVFEEFRTCELSTLARDGTPITWPTLPFWYSDEKRFTVTASIGLAQKALNVRCNPRVSLLFSNPTASGLENPPAVMVQGDAEAPDKIETSVAGFEEELRKVYPRQPASRLYGNDPLTRRLMDWYFMRLMIHVTPRRILWWPGADFWREPCELDVDYVG
jgi:nitroimidazol reductase NimA-like FMN-containing flavoprotein (pyridoxamine 5'-phosphate oxidase superfamily)